MGSGASSQVQAVDAETEKAAAQVEKPVTRMKSAKNRKPSRTNPEPVASTPEKILVQSSPSRTSTVVEVMKTDQSAILESLQAKVEQLEKELGERESEKLDLQDTIQALQDCLAEVNENQNGAASSRQRHSGLEETLKAKDHYIEQLEKQLSSTQAEATKTRVRLKKKIKALTARLNEAKQESSIAHFEMLERSTQLSDEKGLPKSHSLSTSSPVSADEGQESKFKVILDLSTQVSEQAEKIARLEKELMERESEIRMLMDDYAQSRQISQRKPHTVGVDVGDQSSLSRAVGGPGTRSFRSDSLGGRFKSSADSGSGNNLIARSDEKFGAKHKSDKQKGSLTNKRAQLPPKGLALERQSTALSDSDSDWALESNPTKIQSAPARTRVKSTALADNKNKNCKNTPEEDKWSIATDDNDLLFSGESKSLQHSDSKRKRKIALKSKLEHTRNERSKALMGPSLAFEAPPKDQLTDTSCNNTPTPRGSVQDFEFTTVEEMSFVV